jgi:hypothetical protein
MIALCTVPILGKGPPENLTFVPRIKIYFKCFLKIKIQQTIGPLFVGLRSPCLVLITVKVTLKILGIKFTLNPSKL